MKRLVLRQYLSVFKVSVIIPGYVIEFTHWGIQHTSTHAFIHEHKCGHALTHTRGCMKEPTFHFFQGVINCFVYQELIVHTCRQIREGSYAYLVAFEECKLTAEKSGRIPRLKIDRS